MLISTILLQLLYDVDRYNAVLPVLVALEISYDGNRVVSYDGDRYNTVLA